jgi:hypothetical protein
MTTLPEPAAAPVEQSAADATARIARTSKQTMDFVFGAQGILFEEIVFAANEMLDRTRTETHLLSEFLSKMAGSHSVKDLRTMWLECGQHQIDFIRRDSERLFKHGGRMIETMPKLFSNRPQTGSIFVVQKAGHPVASERNEFHAATDIDLAKG